MRKIAITGQLAAGKSSICRFFEESGAIVINADTIVHEILSSSTPHIQAIVELLGPTVLEKGMINRAQVAEIVFNDRKKLNQLESILHPEVALRIQSIYNSLSSQKKWAFVAEVPLLYAIGLSDFFDAVISVIASNSTRLARFMEKGFSKEQFIKRSNRLKEHDIKLKQANYTVENNGSKVELKQQISNIINHIRKDAIHE